MVSFTLKQSVFASSPDDTGDTIADANDVIVLLATAAGVQPIDHWVETDWRLFHTGLVARMEDSLDIGWTNIAG